MITLSATDYITDALADLGVLRLGQKPNADLLAGGKRALDQMLELWLLDELLVYASQGDLWTLQAGRQSYTIGPGGDFNGPRPTSIDAANVVLNTTAPAVHRGMNILPSAAEWARITIPDLPFAIPTRLYYDKGFDANGCGAIHIWPGPQTSYQLELFTWTQLQQFADLTTPYAFPPGYSLLIRKSLALTMLPAMRAYVKLPKQDLDAIAADAVAARAAIESYNAPDVIVRCDPAFCGSSRRGGFNWGTGE